MATWSDRSGQANHATQATGSKQPLYFTKRNLLTTNQASLETNATGWLALANCTLARSTAQALHGVGSLALTASAIGVMSAITSTGLNAVPVVAGQTYTAVCASRAATTSRICFVGIFWYDSAGVFLSSNTGSSTANSNAAWTAHSFSAAAPANAAFASVRVQVNDAATAAGEVHYVDGISLHEGTSTAYRHPTSLVKPVVQFDGVDDYLVNGAFPAMANKTVFIVGTSLAVSGSSKRLVSFGGSFASVYDNTGGVWHWWRNQAAGTAALGGSSRSPSILALTLAGASSMTPHYNGTAVGAGFDPDDLVTTGAGIALATENNAGSSNWLESHIAEVIIYNRALSDAERKKVEKYLGRKYGITVA